MANEPQTFRDHALSLLQSAAAEAGRETGGVGLTIPSGMENDLVRATAQIGALRMQGAAIPLTAPAGVLQTTWDCAKLGFDLLHAKIAGDTAEVQKLQGELDFPAQAGSAFTRISGGGSSSRCERLLSGRPDHPSAWDCDRLLWVEPCRLPAEGRMAGGGEQTRRSGWPGRTAVAGGFASLPIYSPGDALA